MNKKFKYYAVIWAIMLAVFNVICFVTPNEFAGYSKFDGAFWTGYIFITIAFIGQLVCAYIGLNTDDNRKLFYNIPIISISYTGLIVMFVAGAACMAIPDLPSWVGIIACVIVLAFTAVAVIKSSAAADLVEEIDTKVKVKTQFIKLLTVDAESLLSRANTPEDKAVCKKVYEAIRYSDPMSNDALSEIEGSISLKFKELVNAISKNEDASRLAEETIELINDRNRKCKVLK